jgi:hypothetical protein
MDGRIEGVGRVGWGGIYFQFEWGLSGLNKKLKKKDRRDWHPLQTLESKRLLNTATQELTSSMTTKRTAFKHSCKVLHQ